MEILVCPYCDSEVKLSQVEAEEGCCPECGSAISTDAAYTDDYDDDQDGLDDYDDYGDDVDDDYDEDDDDDEKYDDEEEDYDDDDEDDKKYR
ncbi:MAG TPA: hypothetical protein DD381_14215 [Lentisphaeria bacterium]|nr:MAG: hypothetical protein A2X47_01050 [Lentisphaerae bacterium GWF2_38_69]HBM17479.1 hypothetical protein [Lentisphaeria bacterium]